MEKLQKSFIISFFIILTLACALLALLGIYSFWNIREQRISTPQATDEALEVFANDTILGKTEDLGQNYIDKIIFLGESTTYGLQRYGVLSGGTSTNQVWTGATFSNGVPVSAGTLSISPSIASTKIFYPDSGEALTIRQAVLRKSPEMLIITLGLNNGASYYSKEEFKACYRLLLDSISDSFGSTKVILQSLFPVAQSCTIKAYTPQRIEECNGWILEIAEEYGLKYLDTAECLADENGYLISEYENGGDGLHLNALGLNKVLEYIRTHGIEGALK